MAGPGFEAASGLQSQYQESLLFLGLFFIHDKEHMSTRGGAGGRQRIPLKGIHQVMVSFPRSSASQDPGHLHTLPMCFKADLWSEPAGSHVASSTDVQFAANWATKLA